MNNDEQVSSSFALKLGIYVSVSTKNNYHQSVFTNFFINLENIANDLSWFSLYNFFYVYVINELCDFLTFFNTMFFVNIEVIPWWQNRVDSLNFFISCKEEIWKKKKNGKILKYTHILCIVSLQFLYYSYHISQRVNLDLLDMAKDIIFWKIFVSDEMKMFRRKYDARDFSLSVFCLLFFHFVFYAEYIFFSRPSIS